MSVKPLLNAFRDTLSLRDEPVVQEWFEGFDWNLSERNIVPNTVSGCRHLDGIIDHAGKGEQRLVRAFLDAGPELCWGQTYSAEDFGQDFIDNYGWVEVFGTRGHFACDSMAGGFVLFGLGLDYPAHWHVAEEIYLPLTGGSKWMKDDGPYVARSSGELVYHESNQAHGMKMSEAPLLALYVWRGGDLTQKSNY